METYNPRKLFKSIRDRDSNREILHKNNNKLSHSHSKTDSESASSSEGFILKNEKADNFIPDLSSSPRELYLNNIIGETELDIGSTAGEIGSGLSFTGEVGSGICSRSGTDKRLKSNPLSDCYLIDVLTVQNELLAVRRDRSRSRGERSSQERESSGESGEESESSSVLLGSIIDSEREDSCGEPFSSDSSLGSNSSISNGHNIGENENFINRPPSSNCNSSSSSGIGNCNSSASAGGNSICKNNKGKSKTFKKLLNIGGSLSGKNGGGGGKSFISSSEEEIPKIISISHLNSKDAENVSGRGGGGGNHHKGKTEENCPLCLSNFYYLGDARNPEDLSLAGLEGKSSGAGAVKILDAEKCRKESLSSSLSSLTSPSVSASESASVQALGEGDMTMTEPRKEMERSPSPYYVRIRRDMPSSYSPPLTTPSNFGVNKQGQLVIDYSTNWDSLESYVKNLKLS